ncbi:MAG TPA: hypothetical protein VGL89_19855 [Candidatus Koribacter sp.]
MNSRSTLFARRYPLRSLTPVLITLGIAVPLVAQQPSAPQGVYHCTNGYMLTVSRCGKLQGQDACYFKIENKGQVLMDSPGSLSGVNKIVKKCKGEEAEAQAVVSPAATLGPTNPSYLSEMPTPARIVAEIKGKDAEDTGERQMGAFMALVKIIDDMAWGLGHRYVNDADNRAATPDEKRIRFAYETAYADLWHKVTNREGHVYDHDPALRNELLAKFFSENFRAQYFQSDKNAMAGYKAFQEKMYPKTPPPGSNGPAAGERGMANDAGSVAVRHCVESGRSEIECLGEGFKEGLKELTGGHSLTEGIVPETPTGLRLTGVYSGEKFALTFGLDNVTVNCGTLVPQGVGYTVERNDLQVLVRVPLSPKPIVLSYKADGKLAGPGPVDVAGRVVIGGMHDSTSTGYQMQANTTTTQKQIDANDVPNYNASDVHQNGMEFSTNQQTTTYEMAPTTVHHYSVPTAPKTEHCNVASLAPTGQAQSVSGVLTTVLGSQARKSSNTTPGLRLNGSYGAPNGLKIEFREDSATLECGEARNSEGYVVVPENGQLVVKFQNNTGPLSFILQPNGSLAGPATIDVAGRKAHQGAYGHLAYTPQNARCSVGMLIAGKQQVRQAQR